MDDIICFDTSTLSHYIWPDQRYLSKHKKAKRLVEELEKKKAKLYISTVALAELLARFPEESKREELFNKLEGLFKFADFDIKSAFQTSSLYKKQQELKKTDNDEIQISRDHIKIDCQIIGTAKAIGASCLYSEDKGIPGISEGVIKVVQLKDYAYQGELFT